MIVTDKNYNDIADGVYKVDAGKVIRPWRNGKTFKTNGKDYRVLKAEDNPDNGMQAMAVAPIKDGKEDRSHIVIAYAGTNSSDIRDIDTDIQSVVFGDDQYLCTHEEPDSFKVVKSQLSTAKAFSDYIRTSYPNAAISYTGHSLGGYLALITAAHAKQPATVFNAPSSVNNLSKEAIDFVKANKGLYHSYRINNDYIGNLGTYFGDDELGISRWVDGKAGIGRHSLAAYRFNSKGQIVDRKGHPAAAQAPALATLSSRLTDYRQLKKEYAASNGISSSEEFYLDQFQSRAVAQALEQITQLAQEEIIARRKEAVAEAEALHQKTRDMPFFVSELSWAELEEAYAQAGVTYDSLVGQTKRHFDDKVTQARGLATKFKTLKEQLEEGIERTIATDQKLGGDFS
ncbi:TPA: hypothetical protein TUR69_000655 [Streptococcus equi subsp. zooepidemicus]|nr:hypothetical protein [Streptococcus equi]SQF82274.1 Predicted lipase [Streptococcus equi subsp. zooepidemicus]HEL0560471.1 hypothetical protein [Streptococcus equi subsp. zooepidemicus]HEL0610352.1 hypothetical protein [Streptococcus equi subsp. zooepidemicus]HEL0636456.1 hypothetical protein [Streptococcus equi subsp. zooepidemicus]HEL0693508.1 hypothetical protein [Streptococcus equi subsp. zooepidemicus]